MLPAQLVTEQSGGFVQVMNELRNLRDGFGNMVIDDQPIGLIEPSLEGEVRDPGSFLAQFPLTPGVVMISFQRRIEIKELSSQSLQQNSGDQPIEIALVGDDHIRPWQNLRHACKNN